jgi:ABC-type phosphate transport system permease subunit
MLTGGLLGFARALGEFGAIVLVAGNIPLKTQTAAVYLWTGGRGQFTCCKCGFGDFGFHLIARYAFGGMVAKEKFTCLKNQ